MKNKESMLPAAIEIAAKCEALDKVQIILKERTAGSHAYNPEIRVLRIGNWKDRLVNKSVDHLTKRITQFCNMSTGKPIFVPYCLGNFKEEGVWAYNDMQYDIIPT